MLNPVRLRVQVLIRAAPEEVWRILQNPGATPGLLPKGSSIELLTDRFDQVGSQWRVVTRSGRKQAAVLNEVLAIEKPFSQELRSTTERMTGKSRTTLRPTEGGTVMTIEGTAEFRPGLQTLPDRLLTAILGPMSSQRSINRMKRLIEGKRG